jgi:2-polyprenyl-3-methyl-5-hydroxy-6-metoxy-1,4-benzoquinol methylase
MDCGVEFTNPMATWQRLNEHYAPFGAETIERSHLQSASELLAELKRQHWDSYGELTRALPGEPKRFLDVGSALGGLVRLFQDLGWEESIGIEPSSSSVQYARESMGCRDIRQGPVEDVGFPADYFSYIIMWHVIEHLRDPKGVLERIYQWLQPGGMFHLGTPNTGSLVAWLSRLLSGHYGLGDGHTFGFPAPVLRNLVEQIGFEVIEHRVYTAGSRKGWKRRFLAAITPASWANKVYGNMQSLDLRKPIRMTEPGRLQNSL